MALARIPAEVYIRTHMRNAVRLVTGLLLAAGALPCLSQVLLAQAFSADYELTRPMQPASSALDSDLMPRGRPLAFGSVRLSSASGPASSGAGLSVEAGQQWFGRLTVGRSLEQNQLTLGGGYRWRDGQAVSMQLTRGTGSAERLGLAVRYDWPRYYLRVGYDFRSGEGAVDILRFSAGIRF